MYDHIFKASVHNYFSVLTCALSWFAFLYVSTLGMLISSDQTKIAL